MSVLERYISHQDYTELTDAQGEIVEWIATDFRDGEKSGYNQKKFRMEFAQYNPMDLKIMAMMERDKKKKRWVLIAFITGVIAVLSWYSIWH